MNRLALAAVSGLTLLGALGMAAAVTAQTGAGEAAFFWFDSEKISASGEPFYGAYAYRHLLPAFSPKGRSTRDSFAYFDGDFLPQSAMSIPSQGSEESPVAERARQLGSLAYVIAIYSYQANSPFRNVDKMLRAAGTTGYFGLTTRASLDIDTFVQLTRRMSLPVAMKQEGAILRIVDFTFISPADLRKMGFEPQVAAQ